MHRLYLSRRNLETLLNRLNSGSVQAAILKNDTSHPKHPTSVPTYVIALEDSEYYPKDYSFEPLPSPAPEPPAPKAASGKISISRKRV